MSKDNGTPIQRTTPMTRKDIITLATDRGHSVSKAIEIAIDLERGDDFTIKWVHALNQDNPR